MLPASLYPSTLLISTYISSNVTKVFEDPMRPHDKDSGARRDTTCSQFVGA